MRVHPPDERGRLLLEQSLRWVENACPGMGARTGVALGQKVSLGVAAVALAVLFVLWPRGTAVMLTTTFSLLYLATVTHRLLLFRRTLRFGAVEHVDDSAATRFPDDLLPVYTVLVPAYREPEVLSVLVKALEALDYPREKLDVKLLLEEDDAETLAAARAIGTSLPVEVLIVPDGMPRTKPRALNYGFAHARGDLVTIYDAEDKPEPLQLRRAAVAMARLGPEWACLQGKLNFYESRRNLLTRWFSAEYSTWFACYLPGLVSARGIVPLGGTSNHFRRDALAAVGAWDAFNVTEDADLGIRLQRKGYRIGVLDSLTLEEPNNDLVNWVKQRSRWHKGYLVTTLVHLRRPVSAWRDLGVRGITDLFLFVLGTPLLAVFNTVFWALAVVYIVAQPSFVEVTFPGYAFHLGALAWVLGNFTILYLTVATLWVVGRDDLLWAALLVPLYWVLMTIAAVRAVVQLVFDPFHWEKTTHGLVSDGAVGNGAGGADGARVDRQPLDTA